MSVALIDIGEAVPLFAIFFFTEGEVVERLAERSELGGMDTWFAGFCTEEEALDADVVADIHESPCSPAVGVPLIEVVFADVDLDFAVAIAKVRKGGFAHFSDGDDSPGE